MPINNDVGRTAPVAFDVANIDPQRLSSVSYVWRALARSLASNGAAAPASRERSATRRLEQWQWVKAALISGLGYKRAMEAVPKLSEEAKAKLGTMEPTVLSTLLRSGLSLGEVLKLSKEQVRTLNAFGQTGAGHTAEKSLSVLAVLLRGEGPAGVLSLLGALLERGLTGEQIASASAQDLKTIGRADKYVAKDLFSVGFNIQECAKVAPYLADWYQRFPVDRSLFTILLAHLRGNPDRPGAAVKLMLCEMLSAMTSGDMAQARGWLKGDMKTLLAIATDVSNQGLAGDKWLQRLFPPDAHGPELALKLHDEGISVYQMYGLACAGWTYQDLADVMLYPDSKGARLYKSNKVENWNNYIALSDALQAAHKGPEKNW